MSKIIAVCNEKGGVGKTTTAINISAVLAKKKKKVLLIDLDPQASLTKSLSLEGECDSKTLFTVLTQQHNITDIIVRKNNYNVVPSCGMSGADTRLVSIPGKDFLLKEAISPISDKYDYIIIDCPPSLGTLTLNALVCADELIITLQAEYLALEGIAELMKTITTIRNRLNTHLSILGIVCTMYDKRIKVHNEVVERARDFFSTKVFDTYIRRNVALSEAPANGMDILEYSPDSNGAIDYTELCKEIMKRSKKHE
jgi:chromosome partitioning protein